MDIVSIIVPVYNSSSYVSKTIDSILNQTYKYFELILIDDGSTDSSLTILKSYEKKDNRIKVISKTNEGTSSTRNLGISIAKGKYISFIDSDDWIENDMIEIMLDKIKSSQAECVLCGYYMDRFLSNNKVNTSIVSSSSGIYTDKNNQLTDKVMELKKGGLIDSGCNKLYQLNIIRKYNLSMPVGELYEDTEFNFKYFHYVDKLCVVEKPLYHYVQRNISRNTTNKTLNKFLYLSKRVLTMYEFLKSKNGLNNKNIEALQYWFVRYFYSMCIDLYYSKNDFNNFVYGIPDSETYLLLKNFNVKYSNIFRKIYIQSLMNMNISQVKLIAFSEAKIKNLRNRR